MAHRVTVPYTKIRGFTLLLSVLSSIVFASSLHWQSNNNLYIATQYERFWQETVQRVNLGDQNATGNAIHRWKNRPITFSRGINQNGAETIVSWPRNALNQGVSASSHLAFSLIRDLTLGEVSNLDPEACTVFAKYLDPTQLQSVSTECTARLVANCNNPLVRGNSALSLRGIPYSWFVGELGIHLFTALHDHGLLSNLPAITLSTLFSTERFCSLLRAEHIGSVETPEYPLKSLAPECVAKMQNLDCVPLAPAIVGAMGPAAFSKMGVLVHADTFKRMSAIQYASYGQDVPELPRKQCAGRLEWQDLLANVDYLKGLPRLFEPYDVAYPIPDVSLTKEIFAELADHSPAIAGRLLVVLPVLPDDILSLCGPRALYSLRAYKCLQFIDSGIDVLGDLNHHSNSRQIIENIPSEYCKHLSLEDYLKYKWIRASLSSECREKLPFKTDPEAIKQAPEMADENYKAELFPNEQRHFTTEEELGALVTDIAWVPCSVHNTHADLECSQGLFSVPLDYESPNGEWINVEVYRYIFIGANPTSQVIMLAGGPGGSVFRYKSCTDKILRRTYDSTAVYYYEHRGLGANGFKPDHISARPLHDIISTAPFDMKYLTVENAALDVSLFAKAIKRDIPATSTQVGLFGVSYGAALAHHVVQLFPNMFDFAVLAGVPSIPGETGIDNYNGLLLHCQMDEFCRSKIGTVADFKAVLKEVASNRHLNQCTEYFHETLRLEEQWTVGRRIRSIGEQLISDLTNAMTARLLLPVIKSTFDCQNYSIYKCALHSVMNLRTSAYPPVPLKKPTGHHKKDESNDTILDVVSLDYRLKDMKFDIIGAQEKQLELFSSLTKEDSTYDTYRRAGECLAGRRLSQIKPAVTRKTFFIIFQNLLDLVTPFQAGENLFAKIEAPQKWLIRTDSHQHSYSEVLMAILVQGATFGGNIMFNELQAKVGTTDIGLPGFWDLSSLPAVKGIWDIVSDIKHKTEAPIVPPRIMKVGSIKIAQFRSIMASFRNRLTWGPSKEASPTVNVTVGWFVPGKNGIKMNKFQPKGTQSIRHIIVFPRIDESRQQLIQRLFGIIDQLQCSVYVLCAKAAIKADPENLSLITRELLLFATAIRNNDPDIMFQMDQPPDDPELPLKMAQLFPGLFIA
ncbi:Hydrolase alpha/beta hydrolase fold family protein [Paramicrosporidium saccamoebae]|uniref:Hydrolase alpha/beta hydrolase fold family protein n=1 Tax=Paramicrosporidium saccamoebae TaxID=1246581 RepID=A0A2H9TMG5_9FUNG|nr:Hydrolase alpha/beta hydrolase fold family protein [Paramicrosporidium saccamoebae]